ncbi:MAG: hypothetical protein H6586_04935 [Flavobacteriales bacterium]|nr:hypothetical protein [Flavobacteriales bacterium]
MSNKEKKIFKPIEYLELPFNYRFLEITDKTIITHISEIKRISINKVQNKCALQDVFYKSVYRIDL